MKLFSNNDEALVKNYINLNKSKTKQLIFPLTNRGFYSEINNLALAMLYSLSNDLHLKVYTKKWVGGSLKDYFIPVLEEYSGFVPIPASSVFSLSRKEKIYNIYHSSFMNRKLVQNSIWSKMRSKEFVEKSFMIPELDINGDIFHAKQKMLNILLRLNPNLQDELLRKLGKFRKIQPNHFGIHVRRGDKVSGKSKETDAQEIEKYIQKAFEVDDKVKEFIICTDDYSVIEDFEANYPNLKFHTTCKVDSRGYNQNNINLSNPTEQNKEAKSIIFDSILLINSKAFIGTNSSNVGRFITLIRNNKNCYSIDNEWSPL